MEMNELETIFLIASILAIAIVPAGVVLGVIQRELNKLQKRLADGVITPDEVIATIEGGINILGAIRIFIIKVLKRE